MLLIVLINLVIKLTDPVYDTVICPDGVTLACSFGATDVITTSSTNSVVRAAFTAVRDSSVARFRGGAVDDWPESGIRLRFGDFGLSVDSTGFGAGLGSLAFCVFLNEFRGPSL